MNRNANALPQPTTRPPVGDAWRSRSNEQPPPLYPIVEPRPSTPTKTAESVAAANMTRGQRVIAFIEEYCRVPEGRLVGQRMQLADFQKKFILDVYDNPLAVTHTAILSMARKNAKTSTIACLLLAHTVGPEAVTNSQIVSGAMSRDQAALVFKLAVKMVNLDPRLKAVSRVIPTHKMIVGVAKNVEYHAVSAEATTAYGLSPIVVILDEMGQIVGPVSPFVEALTTSQGAYEHPLLFVISTSAASDADMLSLWIDDALRGDDPGIVVHEYRADDNCDLLDEKQWAKANPGLGTIRSRADLEKQLRKAARLPALENTARNLLLNQRVALVNKWLAPTPWKACSGKPDIELFRSGVPVALGLDLSSRLDLTAAVLAATDASGFTHVLCYAFCPLDGIRERAERDRAPYELWVKQGWLTPTPGRTVDYDWVAEFMKREVERLGINVDKLAFDRWKIETFRKAADAVGFAQETEWLEVGQGFKDMAPRMISFEALVLNGKLRHGSNPVLNMAAANAIASSDPAGNRKLDKLKTTQKIDPLAAAVMATFEVAEGAEAELDLAGMIG